MQPEIDDQAPVFLAESQPKQLRDRSRSPSFLQTPPIRQTPLSGLNRQPPGAGPLPVQVSVVHARLSLQAYGVPLQTPAVLQRSL